MAYLYSRIFPYQSNGPAFTGKKNGPPIGGPRSYAETKNQEGGAQTLKRATKFFKPAARFVN